MRAAMDRRRLLPAIGPILLASLPGCARLATLNPIGRPTTAPGADPLPGSARSGEGYIGRMSHGTAPEGEGVTLASRKDGPANPDRTDAATGGDDEADSPISVALRAPRIDDPAPRPAADDPEATLKEVVSKARKSIDGIADYQLSMSRQERVGGALQPAEEVVLSLRRAPLAVRIEWHDGPNKGREAIYSAEPGDGLLHVRMPNSLVSRTSISPTSPLVLRKSRHPITDAGFDPIIARLESDLRDAADGRLRYGGIARPDGVARACHKIERVNPAGETWLVYLDAETTLPVAVRGTSKSGDLLERYDFRDLKTDVPALADASAFDADRRWGPSRGLFGRMAQGQPGEDSTRR